MDNGFVFSIVWRIFWTLTDTILVCTLLPLRYILYYENAFEKGKPLWRDEQ